MLQTVSISQKHQFVFELPVQGLSRHNPDVHIRFEPFTRAHSRAEQDDLLNEMAVVFQEMGCEIQDSSSFVFG